MMQRSITSGKEIPALIANISERGRKVGLEISSLTQCQKVMVQGMSS